MLLTNSAYYKSTTIIYNNDNTFSAITAYNINGCLIVKLHDRILFNIRGIYGMAESSGTMINIPIICQPIISTHCKRLLSYKYLIHKRYTTLHLKHSIQYSEISLQREYQDNIPIMIIDDYITPTDYLDLGILLSPISLVINNLQMVDYNIYNAISSLI